MIGKRDVLTQFQKQSALELKWCRAADCSRGGFQPQKRMSDIRSQAVRTMTTRDGGGWNRQQM